MLLLCAILLGGACKKEEATPPVGAAGSAAAGSGSGSASAVEPGTVEVFVDDKSVARVTPAQIASWPRLDGLVPEDVRRLGTWKRVQLVGATTSEVTKPSANFPDKVPALFPADGGAAFGMFDAVELAKHGKAATEARGLREIRITTAKEGRMGDHQGGTGEETDPTKLVIAIKTPTGDKQLTGVQLLALPRGVQPGNDEQHGWRLPQLLEAAGVTGYKKLIVLDAAGASVILEQADLADTANVVPFIKLNKQGSLRFRLMKKAGDGWQAAGDLRSLVEIQAQ